MIIDKEKRMIQMELELDDSICTVMDYFEIFLKRMMMCRRAAERLNCNSGWWRMEINYVDCKGEKYGKHLHEQRIVLAEI